MEKAVFENLKKFEYNCVKLSEAASWAIWDKKDINNLEIIEENTEKLKGGIVFIGLNCSAGVPNWKNWQNFHCDGFGDRRLRDLLSGTRYEGAYMTDIIKNYNNPDAELAVKIFKSYETKRNKDLDFLFQEIEQLKTNNIEMYLFGEKAEWLFENFVMKHDNFKSFKQKVNKCQRIHHYSGQVTDFEKKARVQLDLAEPKNPIENGWKYKPLWG